MNTAVRSAARASMSRPPRTSSGLGVARRRVLLLLIVMMLVLLCVKAPVTAWFSRAPRAVHVGSNWGKGYVVMPQRASMPAHSRKAQGDRAALLARQRGLAVVAAGDADDVVVISDRRNQ